MIRSRLTRMALTCSLGLSCQAGGAKFPWGAVGGPVDPSEHADVHTLNAGYQRTRSPVLVREVETSTRAALDYAAYHANFMIADPAPETLPGPPGAPDTSNPFHGLIEKTSLSGDLRKTTLNENERRHPLAFSPLVEFLQSRKIAGAGALEDLGAVVRSEAWGLPSHTGTPSQSISEVFLHLPAHGMAEVWVKVEFQPWFSAFRDLPDQDRDGYPEVYGRLQSNLVNPAIIESLQRDYITPVLTPPEIKKWANQLSSYWYPSFNTDLIPAGASWPDDHTEADIKQALGGRVFASPTIVLRGKPQGKATYDVFIVKTPNDGGAPAPQAHVIPKLPKSKPTPEPRGMAETIARELATQGKGSWAEWAAQVAPFDDSIRRRLQSSSPKIKALAGSDGFLFYRHSLEYVVGGDLEKQRKGKNPLPIIVEFQRALAAQGVDFLFVPVPTKAEILPDELDPKGKELIGHIVNPFSRKFLQSLALAGVEVVDLLSPFLQTRAAGEKSAGEPLFQHQDTHWTDRALRLSADILAARLRRYPWYPALAPYAQTFNTRDTTFTRFGDLHSRLPEGEKSKYQPETLAARQVLCADGTPYEDDPDSPIVVLGDSFTGVYELTDAEHAGISAHLARLVSYPVDLVMSYGGGPNVRQKLMRRGTDALAAKKVVIWIMTSRDLYDYWENWEPLHSP